MELIEEYGANGVRGYSPSFGEYIDHTVAGQTELRNFQMRIAARFQAELHAQPQSSVQGELHGAHGIFCRAAYLSYMVLLWQ